MSSLNINLLKNLSEATGVSGYESSIRNIVIEEIKNLVDTWYIDNIGNLIAIKKGSNSNKKLLVAAHLDEIGFMVRHIEENGFLRFVPLGGFDAKTLTSMRVTVHGKKDFVGVMGSKPIHVMTDEERKLAVKVSDFYIDLGLPKAEVEKYISVGNPITRLQSFLEIGNCINGKSLDNRISVFILIETLKELKNTTIPYDFYAVFSVQEEVGIRGIKNAVHYINPDFGLALDVTIANDTLGVSSYEKVTELGKGTAIKMMDSSTICDYRMVHFLKELAENNNILWQPEILLGGGTDAAMIQSFGKNGTITGAISIPLRYVHQTIEMADKSDILSTIELLKLTVTNINNYDWKHL